MRQRTNKAPRITKKQLAARETFKQRIREELMKCGGKEHNGLYPYILQTPIGVLNVDIWDNSVMCRFDDEKQATRFTAGASNPYSGKWNFHFDDTESALQFGAQRFAWELERLMAYVPHQEQRAGA